MKTTKLWSEYYNAFHSVAYNHLFYFPWVHILSLLSTQCCLLKYAQFLFLDLKFVSVKSGHVSGSHPYNMFREKKSCPKSREIQFL